MALKFAFLAAVCIAQAFAFQPLGYFRSKNDCRNPASEIPMEFEETLHEMDEVRDTVSSAAMDAYAKGQNFQVIIACFKEQREKFVQLGERVSEMMNDASQEMNKLLGEKAEKYAKLMEAPMRIIASTIRTLPEVVYNFIQNREYLKAMEAMKEARRIVEENSRLLGKVMQDMVDEVPEMADRAEELARGIRKEARKGVDAINEAFRQCVEAGGPHKAKN